MEFPHEDWDFVMNVNAKAVVFPMSVSGKNYDKAR